MPLSDAELASRIAGLVQQDSELMKEIQLVKQSKQQGFFGKIWTKVKASMYAVLGIWIGEDVLKTTMKLLGFK
ncbi:MAG: hypothetical protein U0354_07870 [Candidatus Sericytochromatia bacterium]